MTPTPLNFEGRTYRIAPVIRLICEIEDELGGIPQLAADFSSNGWRISDLVSLVHMMLASAGKETDYSVLGNRVLEEGVGKYLLAAQRFLCGLTPRPASTALTGGAFPADK